MARPRQKPGSACQECRRRKLGCDRAQPRCSVCVDTGKECIVNAASARGPKPGHLKALQARIVALEESLSNRQRSNSEDSSASSSTPEANSSDTYSEDARLPSNDTIETLLYTPLWQSNTTDRMNSVTSMAPSSIESPFQHAMDTTELDTTLLSPSLPVNEPMTLPLFDLNFMTPESITQSSVSPTSYDETMDFPDALPDLLHADRDQLYFDRVHCFIPILRQSDYRSWSHDPSKTEAQACLQQTMWALAVSASAQYQNAGACIYSSARRALARAEAKNKSLTNVETAQVQAYLLLSFYEFTRVDFHRGYMTAGHAFRLIQLLRWHEIDLVETAIATTMPEWVEIESRRRAFWVAFVLDRLLSMRQGTPLTISEQAIAVRLPAPDSNFQAGKPTLTETLSEAIMSSESVSRNTFTDLVLVATICGRAVSHRNRALFERGGSSKPPNDFWNRQKWLYTALSTRSMALAIADHFEPTTIFLRILVQVTLLYLHQLLETSMPLGEDECTFVTDSANRSEAAMQEIENLAQLLSSLGCYKIHPLVPVPLYLCVDYLTMSGGTSEKTRDSLQVILQTLNIMKQVNMLGLDSAGTLSPSVIQSACSPVIQHPTSQQEPQLLWC